MGMADGVSVVPRCENADHDTDMIAANMNPAVNFVMSTFSNLSMYAHVRTVSSLIQWIANKYEVPRNRPLNKGRAFKARPLFDCRALHIHKLWHHGFIAFHDD